MFLPKAVAKGLMSVVFVVRMVASEGQKRANIASPSMMHCFGASAAMARSNARIPTSNFPANGAEFLVFVGMTVSPRHAPTHP